VSKLPLAEIATRSVAFVGESLARFENLLRDNEHYLARNERQIFSSLEQRAAEIRTRLFRRVTTLVAARDKKHELGLARSTVEATPIYSSIVELHRDLRHVPIPALRRESEVFVRSLWCRLQTMPSAKSEEPAALHLSHDLIHGQHNVRNGPAVIDLPKLDYAAPLTWPLILHEVAHSTLPPVDVPPNLSPIVSSWLIEAGCDRLAFRICGPSYLAAFALRTFVDRTYLVGTNRHPPGRLRLEAFESCVPPSKTPTALFDVVSSVIADRAKASEVGGVKLQEAGSRTLSCQSCKKPYTLIETTEAETTFVAVLPDYIRQLDEQLATLRHVTPDDAHCAQLASQLKSKQLIGASHNQATAESEFQKLQQVIKAQRPGDPIGEPAVKQLEVVVTSLLDQPNDLLDVITGAWINYFDSASDEAFKILGAASPDANGEMWERYKARVRQFDDLLLASIETAHFHGFIGINNAVE